MSAESNKSTSDEKMILRMDIKKNDPLYGNFLSIKEKIGLKSNTEVLRFSIKNTFDSINQIPEA